MGKIVSGVTDAIGLTDTKGERDARNRANDLTDQSLQMSRENIAFQKEQLEEWEDTYGDIEQNLSNYFENLSPEKQAQLGLTASNRNFQEARRVLKETLDQRGLGGSKFAESQLLQADIGQARDTATIRALAEEDVINKQLTFLGLGLGQGGQALGNINQASIAGANTTAQGAATSASIANNMFSNNSATLRQLVPEVSFSL